MSDVVRAMVLGLLVMALCFALGELVEHTVMVHASMSSTHLLHTLRGIISSIATAAVVGWSLVASSPPLLEAPATEAGEGFWPSDLERIAHYSRWLIQMRWVVVVSATAMAVVTVKVVPLLAPDVWSPLVATIALLGAANIVYAGLANRRKLRGLLQIQLALDLVVLTCFLHFTGGVENPLSVAALFHVVFAGILLSRRQCYVLAMLGALLFTMMAWGEWAQVIPHHALASVLVGQEGALYVARDPLSVATHTGVQTGALLLIAYFVTTLADRTRRDERRLEAMAGRALAERQLLERALDTTGTALRVSDASLRVEWANSRWRQWFSDEPLLAEAARRTLHDRQVRMDELVRPADDHRADSVFQLTSAPVVDLDGNVVQVAELAMDVTDQKQAQAQMMRAGKMAAVGELAGQVAHEVNNPIAIISGKARLLLSGHRGEMSDGVAIEVDKIVALADRVADIARGLLSYCRTSPGVHRRLDAREPARHALSMILERARRSGIDVADELPAEPLTVDANSGELEQVFLNLFLNALDAMPHGGRLVLSSPGRSRLPDGRHAVELDVTDSGVGIQPELVEKIFEPFFTTKGEGSGTGLGLCICHGLIESHGGSMSVQSAPGAGAKFRVLLPLAGEAGA